MRIDFGWEAAACAPGSCETPAQAASLDWLPASVPGTAAGALRDAGRWTPDDPRDLDAEDWWFRTRLPATGRFLRLGGVATVAEVFVGGRCVLSSRSMWREHLVDAGTVPEGAELAIRCRALAPLLAERRKPRARWRTHLADGNLRFFRTALLGRAPGIAPGPAAVGPWRPVELLESPPVRVAVQTRMDGDAGVLRVEVDRPGTVEVSCAGVSGGSELRIPSVARWWPHTHGDPVLHEARIAVDGEEVARRRVGFRALTHPADIAKDGLELIINGVPVFARGAVWTPVDFVGLAPSRDAVRAAVAQVRDAGMNVLRIAGTGLYESGDFHDACDELGILVWQDMAFANLDYPITDPGFRAEVEAEARQVLGDLAGRPSLAVVCGNSEVEQQVAMLGLDPALGRGELFGELLPALVRDSGADAAYLPSAPTGGGLPFRFDRGVAHYFGVGGYRRPLHDARRAEVRFAAECLAFANVPDDDAVATTGVPRDANADWDFADVRDFYLRELYGVDPAELRATDPARYLELSRAVTGEAMAEVIGEWRRARSPCAGAVVLAWRDLRPGSGWGLVAAAGEAKAALHHVRRALEPVAVWTTDEGLAGVGVHLANDRPEPLRARLRVALYREDGTRTDEEVEEVELSPRATIERDLEDLLGRFADASYAYRFGPPAHHAVVVSLERDGELLSQAFRFPAGRPLDRRPADELGLRLELEGSELSVYSRLLAYGVRIHCPGATPSDDAFCVEPGGRRRIRLSAGGSTAALRGVSASALNLRGQVRG